MDGGSEGLADRLFRDARTPIAWTDAPVEDDALRALYDLASLGPTSGNCSPARFVFLRTEAAKARLRPMVSAGNRDRVTAAPVVAIVASDPFFYEHLPELAREAGARDWFADDPELAEATARRNATLQGAWLVMAARSMGLDCGPMSGFDNARVDETFLASSGWKSDFLVCLGTADRASQTPRAPRLGFDQACRLL